MIVFNDKNDFMDFIELKFNNNFFLNHFMKFENFMITKKSEVIDMFEMFDVNKNNQIKLIKENEIINFEINGKIETFYIFHLDIYHFIINQNSIIELFEMTNLTDDENYQFLILLLFDIKYEIDKINNIHHKLLNCDENFNDKNDFVEKYNIKFNNHILSEIKLNRKFKQIIKNEIKNHKNTKILK